MPGSGASWRWCCSGLGLTSWATLGSLPLSPTLLCEGADNTVAGRRTRQTTTLGCQSSRLLCLHADPSSQRGKF